VTRKRWSRNEKSATDGGGNVEHATKERFGGNKETEKRIKERELKIRQNFT